MNIRNISLFIAAVFLITSCKKYLDVKPKGRLIPVTVSDFDHLLDNTNLMESNFLDQNKGSSLSGLADNIEMTEGQAKVGYILSSHPNLERYYSYVYRQPYKDPNLQDYFWSNGVSGIYPQITYFNNVINGIRGIEQKSAEEESMGRISIAQALVARAWCYFNANLVYGPVYKPGTGNATKTIPYVVNSDINVPIPDLSTSGEVVSKVFHDLYEALPDLPERSSWPSRAGKATGYAMLAYCHLFTQKFDSVEYYANLAWNTGAAGDAANVLYNYNQFSWNNPNNLVTSPIRSAQDDNLLQYNHRELLFYRGTDKDAGIGSQLSYPSAELIALYDQATDLRFKFFYLNAPGYKTNLGGGYNDGMRISNYRYRKMRITEGFSWPEVLLMRAEAYARNNKISLAIADLNTLRKFRLTMGTPALTTGTQDQVINWVLEERRRELPIGGLKRLLDLKRLALDNGKPWSKTQVTHKIGNQIYTATIDAKDFIMPVSNVVLNFNPNWGIPLETRPF